MGKAKYPHNSSRPSPQAVKKALAKGDMDALRLSLSPRQRAFVDEYLIDFNATAAARRAGYADTKHIDKQAHILTHHEGVAALIAHEMRSREAKLTVADPDYVIKKITTIINKETARDADQLRGLELLAKILGMLKDRTEITGKDGEAIQVKQIEEDSVALVNLLDQLSKKKDVVLV